MKMIPLVLLLFVILGCGGSSTTTTESANNTLVAIESPPITIKAADLTKAYDANEIAADGQYKDKLLVVSGTISSISETFGSVQVDLKGHGIATVKCVFNEDQKASVSNLKKGSVVTLTGRGDGMTVGLFVGLNDCRVK